MELDTKKCYACKKLRRFYTKGNTRYNKTGFGLCTEKQNIVNAKDSCDKFQFKQRRTIVRIGAQRYLNDILMQLTALRCIIEEETNEPSEE